jgi:hypothetical protein
MKKPTPPESFLLALLTTTTTTTLYYHKANKYQDLNILTPTLDLSITISYWHLYSPIKSYDPTFPYT